MSQALRLPGVVDVITAADIPGEKVRKLMAYEEELLAQTQVESQRLRLDPAQAQNWTRVPSRCPALARCCALWSLIRGRTPNEPPRP